MHRCRSAESPHAPYGGNGGGSGGAPCLREHQLLCCTKTLAPLRNFQRNQGLHMITRIVYTRYEAGIYPRVRTSPGSHTRPPSTDRTCCFPRKRGGGRVLTRAVHQTEMAHNGLFALASNRYACGLSTFAFLHTTLSVKGCLGINMNNQAVVTLGCLRRIWLC